MRVLQVISLDRVVQNLSNSLNKLLLDSAFWADTQVVGFVLLFMRRVRCLPIISLLKIKNKLSNIPFLVFCHLYLIFFFRLNFHNFITSGDSVLLLLLLLVADARLRVVVCVVC